jgi:hypothetical protein
MEEATSTSVSLLDAIRDLNKAWHLNVTAKTLAKCFKKARFAKIEGEINNWPWLSYMGSGLPTKML